MADPALVAIIENLPEKKGKEAMNVKIGRELKRRLKTYCAASGITMQDFLVLALEDALAKAEKK